MTAGTPLAQPEDVAVLWRPFGPDLSTAEEKGILGLIDRASAQLRNLVPLIDARMGLDPNDPRYLSTDAVAGVVAGAIKLYLDNPGGLASRSQSTGPYSLSESWGRGTIDESRGLIIFPPSLLSQLSAASPSYGTIWTGSVAPFEQTRYPEANAS